MSHGGMADLTIDIIEIYKITAYNCLVVRRLSLRRESRLAQEPPMYNRPL